MTRPNTIEMSYGSYPSRLGYTALADKKARVTVLLDWDTAIGGLFHNKFLWSLDESLD